jgi:hypothetical protein
MRWLALLRRNPYFARLWVAEAISLGGDWFSLVAISVLAVQRGGGEGALAVALTLMAHELPMSLMRPVAGVLADRFDRRNLLIGVHVTQAALTAVMAWRAAAGDIVGLQLLVLLRSLIGGLDWPARAGAIRRLVGPDDLLAAHALGGAMWSSMYAVGMALGGLAASLGVPLALGLDALTFVASAVLLSTLPNTPTRGVEGGWSGALSKAAGDLRSAAAMVRADPALWRAVSAKAPLAMAGGGGVVLLNLIADRGAMFGTAAVTLGTLQAIRGVGTGVGPVVVERLVVGGLALSWLWRGVSWMALGAIAVVATVDAPALVVAAVALWGCGVGANWMISSAELQRLAPDEAVGRLSGFDMLMVEGLFGASALIGALAVEASGEPAAAAWSTLGLAVLLLLLVERLAPKER